MGRRIVGAMLGRCLAAAEATLGKQSRGSASGSSAGAKTSFEAGAREFSWQPTRTDYVEPGLRLLAGDSPWTYHRPASQPLQMAAQMRVALQQPMVIPKQLVQQPRHGPLLFSAEKSRDSDQEGEISEDFEMSAAETRKIVNHVNVVALKKRLKSEARESFSYKELLDVIAESGVACNEEDAMRYARALDEAGVVLIFRENVYLHPERVAKIVTRALPFAVVPPDDPRRTELLKLEEAKAEIDTLAHKHVRRMLQAGLLGLLGQTLIFFRLTFWELSWDVMEPIAFFVTTSGLIAGYSYFLVTARDPSYRDFMQRLFLSRQLKLFKKKNFDYGRYQLLKRQCQCLDPDESRW